MGQRSKISFIHLETQYVKTDCKNEIYAKNWVRRTWTEKVNLGEKSMVKVNAWSKSTVNLEKSTVKYPKSKDDISKHVRARGDAWGRVMARGGV